MIEKILETESGNIHYWISENFRNECGTIFFLHGLTASHDLFVNQIEYFSKDYNVTVWDAPAHGLSRPYKDFTYEKAALAAVQILKDNYIKEAAFVGQSMGGFITQSVLKRFPEYVKCFVSLDSTPLEKNITPGPTDGGLGRSSGCQLFILTRRFVRLLPSSAPQPRGPIRTCFRCYLYMIKRSCAI